MLQHKPWLSVTLYTYTSSSSIYPPLYWVSTDPAELFWLPNLCLALRLLSRSISSASSILLWAVTLQIWRTNRNGYIIMWCVDKKTHSVSSHVLPHVYLLELQTLPHRLYGLSRYCPVHINHVCVSAENLQAFSSVVLLHVRRDNHNVSWSHACGGTRNTGDVKVHGHVCLKTCTSGDSSNIQGALYLGAGEHTCVQATTEVSFMCLGVQESNNLMFCWHRSCKSTIYLSTAEEQPKQGV